MSGTLKLGGNYDKPTIQSGNFLDDNYKYLFQRYEMISPNLEPFISVYFF